MFTTDTLSKGYAHMPAKKTAILVADDDPQIRPQFHTFVDSAAPWDVICDNLPRFAGAWRATDPGEVPML